MATKTELFFMRLSQADRTRQRNLAEAYGMNESEFLRTMVEYVDRVRPQLIITPKQAPQTQQEA